MERIKTIITLVVLTCIFATTNIFAQIRGTNIMVTVTPDHKDWNYKVGEKIEYDVCVLKSSTLLDNANISYEMGPEMYPEVKKDMTLKTGNTKIVGKMSKPGFYKLKVTAHVGGKDYENWCTVAVSPEKIVPSTQCPKDFDVFWTKTVEQARWTSLEPTFELLPLKSTPAVNTYQVSFQNDQWGRRIYGILNVPTKPGKYPALLKVPGAGARPYQGDSWFASHGAILLEIGIHGVPVIYERDYYERLMQTAVNEYWWYGTNDKNKSYYKKVITGCLRAIDFIATLDSLNPSLHVGWDGKNLGVTGSSQGGFLTLVCTALDKRVSCYGAVHAALCDHESSLKKVACGWPHYYYNVANPDPRDIENMRYYDGVNFARRITVPGYFSFGYNDDVVPPTSSYGTYNIVTAEKTLSVYPQTAHFWYQEQWDEWQGWLLKHLGIK